jgi:hypothetical protein
MSNKKSKNHPVIVIGAIIAMVAMVLAIGIPNGKVNPGDGAGRRGSPAGGWGGKGTGKGWGSW